MLTESTTPGGTLWLECEKFKALSITFTNGSAFYYSRNTVFKVAENIEIEEARSIANEIFSAAVPIKKARSIAKHNNLQPEESKRRPKKHATLEALNNF